MRLRAPEYRQARRGVLRDEVDATPFERREDDHSTLHESAARAVKSDRFVKEEDNWPVRAPVSGSCSNTRGSRGSGVEARVVEELVGASSSVSAPSRNAHQSRCPGGLARILGAWFEHRSAADGATEADHIAVIVDKLSPVVVI